MSQDNSLFQHDLLVQSIQNLNRHLKRSQQPSNMQSEVMNNLSNEDLKKIVNQVDGISEKIRKSSAQLLSYLVYKNQKNAQKLLEKLDIPKNTGRIVLNSMPSILSQNGFKMKECLKLLKSPIRKNQLNKMCWIINPFHDRIFMEFLDEIQLNALPDLKTVIFGITYIQNPNQITKNNSIVNKKFSIERKQARSRSKSINKKVKFRGYLNASQQETNQQQAQVVKSSASIDVDIKFIKTSKIIDAPSQNNNQPQKLQVFMYQNMSQTQTSSTQDHYKNKPYMEKLVLNTNSQIYKKGEFKALNDNSPRHHRSYIRYTEQNFKESNQSRIGSQSYVQSGRQVPKISEMRYFKPKLHLHTDHRIQSSRTTYTVRDATNLRQTNMMQYSIPLKHHQQQQQVLQNHIKFRDQKKILP